MLWKPFSELLMDVKKRFITALKRKYKKLYNGVQPIPFIRDKLYCVNTIFVEGGLEFLASSWVMLDSYHHVFREPSIKSERRIITGEAGYGKSTLTLQFAYDWCEQVQESYLKDVEILVLLRLRQLGKVTDVYKAIRRFLLSEDFELTEKDIEGVLNTASSVVFILDGFDEYPDASDGSTDFMKIITSKIFKAFEVIITSRILPEQYTKESKRLRLTGFDDKAREQYLRKAVVGGDEGKAKELAGRLQKNPILQDLCQVPLLFVLFAHMSHENDDFHTFKTVTSFFKYIIKCFHHHMKNKMKDENVQTYHTFEDNHQELDQIAFEALHKKKQKIIWTQETLCDQLGEDFYHQYVRVGILVEDESNEFDSPDRSQKEVRFCHKIFCEWYAAHYLANCANRMSFNRLKDLLVHMDPRDLHHCYRFACGLNPESAGNVIEVLKTKEECAHFPALCILERGGGIDGILDTVRELCSSPIHMDSGDSNLSQRSIIQLLHISSNHQINISELYLYNCIKGVDEDCLQLKSTVTVPVLTTLKTLWIREEGKEMTSEDFESIIRYSSKCSALRKLWLGYCLLPRFVQQESILRSRSFEVVWKPFVKSPLFVLHFDTGTWKREGRETIISDEDYCDAVWEVGNRRLSQENRVSQVQQSR